MYAHRAYWYVIHTRLITKLYSLPLEMRTTDSHHDAESSQNNKHGSSQFVDITRRRFLAAGAAGVAGLGTLENVTAATTKHTLIIEGFGSTTSYSFTVGGNLQKSTADGASINSSDNIVGQSTHGAVGGGKDAYTFTGPLYAFDFDRSGEINVTLDGEAAHVGNRPDHVLSIEGFGSTTSYSCTVEDNLQKSTADGASINSSDDIVGQSAHGVVGGGKDAYTFDGKLYSFDFDRSGEINVMLDGKPAHVGNRADHTLLIEGFGTNTPYSFAVTSGTIVQTDAYDASVNDSDHTNSYGASGAVQSGKDAYTYSGRLQSFDFRRSGEINVTIDGKAAHVGRRPDRTLYIVADGEYTPYEFSVSGSIRGVIQKDGGQDTVDSPSVSGAVSGTGYDAYTYDGDLTALTYPDDTSPEVRSNGELVARTNY